mmetsp:Transcript_29768/g.95224  ORF Transcript_29768/g.95224 Transcript_29768/m.95224 type:complete len:937 (-) Transcript_29768:905-3715(-)
MDFIMLCARRVTGMKPYNNMFNGYSHHDKVRSFIQFLMMDDMEFVESVLEKRFKPVDELVFIQSASRYEAEKESSKNKKYDNVDQARQALSKSWSHLYFLFKFFCFQEDRELPDAHKFTSMIGANPNEQSKDEDGNREQDKEGEKKMELSRRSSQRSQNNPPILKKRSSEMVLTERKVDKQDKNDSPAVSERKEVTNKLQRVPLLRLERSNSQRRALEEGDGGGSEETGYKEERRMKNLPCGPQVLDMLYKIRPQSLYEHEAKKSGARTFITENRPKVKKDLAKKVKAIMWAKRISSARAPQDMRMKTRLGRQEEVLTRVASDDLALQNKVTESWEQISRVSQDFEAAARKIQKLCRSWLTRKIISEGKFLRDGLKAWLSSNTKSDKKDEVRMRLAELIKFCRIFQLCPALISESRLVDIARAASQTSFSADKPAVVWINWSCFQSIIYEVAMFRERQKKAKDQSILKEGESELDILIRLDETVNFLLTGNGEHSFDPSQPAASIRTRVLAYSVAKDVKHKSRLAECVKKVENTLAVTHKLEKGGGKAAEQPGEQTAQSLELRRCLDGYINACRQHKLTPIHTLIAQLPKARVDLCHYSLRGHKAATFGASMEHNSWISELCLCDCRIAADELATILTAVSKTGLTKLDLSENYLNKPGLEALAEFLSSSKTLVSLKARGVALDDSGWDLLVHSGFENSSSLTTIDVAYNQLTDASLDNVEHLVFTKAITRISFAWNLYGPALLPFSSSSSSTTNTTFQSNFILGRFTQAGIQRMRKAASERTKSSRRSKTPRISNLPAILIVADPARMQNLVERARKNGLTDRVAEEMSKVDYMSMFVVLRNPTLSHLSKLQILRMMSSDKFLTADMIVEILTKCFHEAEEPVKKKTLSVLLRKTQYPEDLVAISNGLQKTDFSRHEALQSRSNRSFRSTDMDKI